MADKNEIDAVMSAVVAAWEKIADVPFPLYDQEARLIAEAAIKAYSAYRARV